MVTWDDIAKEFVLATEALEHTTNIFKALSYEELENTVDSAGYIETVFSRNRARLSRCR